MNKLTEQDYKNIEKAVSKDRIFKDEKHTKKMMNLLQKRNDKNASIIKKEYPHLSDNEISEILGEHREYECLLSAADTFTDFPIIYEDSNISKFLTKDDIEEIKIAIEEMENFINKLEVN
ncbi:pathogenicity island protein [Staphylococcus saprophyticus]|uniref:pathogenicity island protein n=1 Tax=Staphylococcus saprophyticus TaxID=29385 RepID=UPI0011A290E2|nr:pathogenicity island protein [Staphylococcus saprophyticus]MBN6850405.1 pathogenicity island protein [Staphylococcus saprophyticus]MDW3878923.1 pathogenicity island protein [Staphylococcus saprophyticus]MDW4114094.1 pathogenicity island protein [Staphylococcus saprophyticus]